MKPRGEASLGDLFVAFDWLLPADAEAREAVAAMLHFDASALPVAGAMPGAWGAPHAPRTRPQPRIPAILPPAPAPRPPVPVARGEPRDALLEPVSGPSTEGVPEWAAGVEPLEPAALPAEVAPPPEPLFHPRQQRAILAAALATRAPDGPLDVRTALRLLAALRPLRRLPRRPLPTLRRGAQLLVDLAPGMAPYAADADAVVRAIGQVAGEPRVQVLTFSGCPTRGVQTASGEEEAYRPPPAGTPVVVVSEMGIGGPLVNPRRPGRAEWLAFARRVRAEGCPAVALVPFAPARWDPAVARHLTFVHWDRPTTAGAVRRAVGPGHAPR